MQYLRPLPSEPHSQERPTDPSCPVLALQGLAWTSLLCLPPGGPRLLLSGWHLLQEACLGCGPEANSLKVFSSSSQRRTSPTKRLWKALTEALSCGCHTEGSDFWGWGAGRSHPGSRLGSLQAIAASPEKDAEHPMTLHIPSRTETRLCVLWGGCDGAPEARWPQP